MTTALQRPAAPPRVRLGVALALLATAQLIFSLDLNIVFVALPEIGAELGFPGQTQQWVVSAYTVFAGGFLLLGGRLADLLGRRRTFVTALSLYAAASLAGGLATDPGLIIGSRAVQGIGGALLLPSTLAIINNLFAEGRTRTRALAVWGGFGASGLTVGALLGGVLTQAFGWPAVFYVNVPLAAAVVLGALLVIPADGARASGNFDLPGALTATVGSTALVFTLVQGPEAGWTSPSVLAAAVAGFALLAAFVAIEARTADPLLPLRLLRNRNLSGAAAITFVFMGTFGALPYFLTTVLFGTKYDYSALATGLAFLLPSAAIFAGTQLGATLTVRLTARAALLTGFGIGVVGTVALAVAFVTEAGFLAAAPGLVVSGLGQGIVWTAMFAAASTGVDPARAGVANGLATTTLNVGNAVGIGALVAVAGAVDGDQRGGFVAVLVAAAAMVIGLGLAAALPRPTR